MTFINLPGIGNSEATHWHSLWEKQESCFRRFAPGDWDNPELQDWKNALDREVRTSTEPPILVAHSLACLLVAHWAQETENRIAGAFLVAVPDPVGGKFPVQAASFDHVPANALPFPTVLIASRNDPYGSFDYVARRAEQWRAGLIDVGERGHINDASGLGEWLEGRRLLTAFQAGLRR
jgi:predicted alpha/beta hydrolase family esterase